MNQNRIEKRSQNEYDECAPSRRALFAGSSLGRSPATGEANGRIMQCIYVLRSAKDRNLYIGCTKDVDKRLKQHSNGQVRATKGRRPFTLIYIERYSDAYEAFRQERFYKSAKGKKVLKEKIYCRIV